MRKKLRLQIATPCHEDWENMDQVEKGRFCSSCKKQVIDFSNMSDREMAIFFKKSSPDSVCGRFMQDQLDKDIEIPKKRIPWVKYFFQFLFPAFLISIRAGAQKGKLPAKDVRKVDYARIPVVGDVDSKVLYTGNSVKLPVKRHITSKSQRQKATILADVRLPRVTKDSLPLLEKNIADKSMSSKQPLVAGQFVARLGGVSITRCYIKKNRRPIQLLQQIFKDTPFSKFKIYPNPIQSNSVLHIEWKQEENGDHILQLYNRSGQLVFTKDLYIDNDAGILNVNMPSVSAGDYFLRVTNKKSAHSFTEKLVVSSK